MSAEALTEFYRKGKVRPLFSLPPSTSSSVATLLSSSCSINSNHPFPPINTLSP